MSKKLQGGPPFPALRSLSPSRRVIRIERRKIGATEQFLTKYWVTLLSFALVCIGVAITVSVVQFGVYATFLAGATIAGVLFNIMLIFVIFNIFSGIGRR
jgi:hypothetical protein